MLAMAEFPPELRDLIVRKAEGNPFFLEEVLKSLLEVGTLRQRDGRYILTKPISEIYVPDTIQDVIMARIDRLEEAPSGPYSSPQSSGASLRSVSWSASRTCKRSSNASSRN